jgi:hypothetical protein
MAKTKKLPQQVIKVKNYGDPRINRLAVVQDQFCKMENDKERRLALEWFMSKYRRAYESQL